MTLANTLQESHENIIFNSRGINSAKKKIESKGKNYSQKDLKFIMQQIDFAVSANKVNGKYMDSYFEGVGDDANHYILAFHTGAMINRLENFENISQNYQFTLTNLANSFPELNKIIAVQYYPVEQISKYLTNEQTEDISRIKRYIKEGILVADVNGNLSEGQAKSNVSQKTIMKAKAYYKYSNGKLYKLFVNPKFANKYVGVILTPKMTEQQIKKYMAVDTKKSYGGKDDKGFLLKFALKIAERSYFITVNGEPLIKIDDYFNQFPEIRQLLNNPLEVAKKTVNVSMLFKNDPSWIKLYSPFMSSTLVLESNFYYHIGHGGAVKYYSREKLLFLKNIMKQEVKILNTYIIGAVDYSHNLKELNKIKEPLGMLKEIAKKDKNIQRLIFHFNKAYEMLVKEQTKINKFKKDLLAIKSQFRNKDFFKMFLIEVVAMRLPDLSIVINNKDLLKKYAKEMLYKEIYGIIKRLITQGRKLEDITFADIEVLSPKGQYDKYTEEEKNTILNEIKEFVISKKIPGYIKDFELIEKEANKISKKLKIAEQKGEYEPLMATYEIIVEEDIKV